MVLAFALLDMALARGRFLDPGVPPPSFILGTGQRRPPYTLDGTITEPLMTCGPTSASTCSVQNSLWQMSQARPLACPELEAGGTRRQAALEVLKKGNFTLEEFGSTGFDVLVLSPTFEVLADPLRPELVGQSFVSKAYSGPVDQSDWLTDYITWVTSWGGGFVPHHSTRFQAEDPEQVVTYIEKCPGSGDMLAVSFKNIKNPGFSDCSRESNALCARVNANWMFGNTLVDFLTISSQTQMSKFWYALSFEQDFKINDSFATVEQLVWQDDNMTDSSVSLKTLGTQVGSGGYSSYNGLNASAFLGEAAGEERTRRLAEAALAGIFVQEFPLTQEAGLIAGVMWNDTAYVLHSLLRHRPKTLAPGPLCTVCLPNASLTCALENAQSLISHSRVDLTLPSFVWDRMTYDPWFGASHDQAYAGEQIWPKGSYVLAFTLEGVCLADGHDPSNVGKTALEIFGNDEAHQSFLTAASMNSRWAAYQEHGERRIGYVNIARFAGARNYIVAPVSRAWASWDKFGECDSTDSEDCSNWRAQVAVGAAAVEVNACTDEACLLEVVEMLSERRGLFSEESIGTFRVHIYDEDMACLSVAEAGGLSCPPGVGRDSAGDLQAAIGADNTAILTLRVQSNPLVAFAYRIQWQAVGSSSKQVFYLVSFVAKTAAAPMCITDDDCPAHSSCSNASRRCVCDSDFAPNMSLIESTCGGYEPTKMECVYIRGQDCSSSSSAASLSLSTCAECRAGAFCHDGYATVCPIGQFCPAGATSPYPCPAGSAGNQTGLEECFDCPPGYASSMVGGQECLACGAGSYAGSWGQSSCDLCPTGYYSIIGQASCHTCPAGTFTNGGGATSVSDCRHCGDGYFYEDQSCKQCPFGFDSHNSADTSCQLLASIQVGLPCSIVFALLCCWVAVVLKKRYRKRLEALQLLADEASKKVFSNAADLIQEFGHPMVLISAEKLLDLSVQQLGGLHEGNRDANRLVFVDSLARWKELKSDGSTMIMLSYPKGSSEVLCPTDAQLSVWKSAVKQAVAKKGWELKSTLIWIDILALPCQARPEMRKLASDSYYLYATCADIFLAAALPLRGSELDPPELANLLAYQHNALHRAEVTSFCCACGPNEVFFFDDHGFRQAPQDFLVKMVHVFDGTMACCAQGHAPTSPPCLAFQLVVPLLGLYLANIHPRPRRSLEQGQPLDAGPCHYRPKLEEQGQSSEAGLDFFRRHVLAHKERIFPRHYRYMCQSKSGGTYSSEACELFGDLLRRADRHSGASQEPGASLHLPG